ncbi:MAG: hypothetical protein MMC33_006940 [Icmadophila ericetorum]|nr:hypothetical protein [Icmadophila ericetorum]
MAPVVVARSLFALTDLSANPPNFPERLGVNVQNPLVLYIARVPGSKDAFLTTQKPRDKVVTAHDLESSLYYFHVDSPKDEELRESMLAEEEHTQEKNVDSIKEAPPVTINGVGRKPLPPNAQLAPTNCRNTPPNGYSQLQPTFDRGRRGMYNAEYRSMVRPHQWDEAPVRAPPVFPLRKLLGPRPMNSEQRFQAANVLQGSLGKENMKSQQFSGQPALGSVSCSLTSPPALPQKLGVFTSQMSGEVDLRPALPPRRDTLDDQHCQGSGDVHQNCPKQTEQRISLPPRRGPSNEGFDQERSRAYSSSPRRANGHQISPSRYDAPSPCDRRSSEEQRPLSITLIRRDPSSGDQWNIGKLTLGASNTARLHGRDIDFQFGDSIAIDISTAGYSKFKDPRKLATPGEPLETSIQEVCFHRKIMMRNASLQSPRRNRFRQSTEICPASEQSTPNLISASQLGFPSLEPTSPASKYTFLSPWNGSCEFTTGLSGRSLKCKHTRSGSSSPFKASNIVSELRFNLPSSKLFRPTTSPKRQSFMSHARHNSTPASPSVRTDRRNSHDNQIRFGDGPTSSSEEEDDGPMDLSLGQEKAGGGLQGKRAKLGKIIVQDEGLQMLDLVVAANMGMWWRAYER